MSKGSNFIFRVFDVTVTSGSISTDDVSGVVIGGDSGVIIMGSAIIMGSSIITEGVHIIGSGITGKSIGGVHSASFNVSVAKTTSGLVRSCTSIEPLEIEIS